MTLAASVGCFITTERKRAAATISLMLPSYHFLDVHGGRHYYHDFARRARHARANTGTPTHADDIQTAHIS